MDIKQGRISIDEGQIDYLINILAPSSSESSSGGGALDIPSPLTPGSPDFVHFHCNLSIELYYFLFL